MNPGLHFTTELTTKLINANWKQTNQYFIFMAVKYYHRHQSFINMVMSKFCSLNITPWDKKYLRLCHIKFFCKTQPWCYSYELYIQYVLLLSKMRKYFFKSTVRYIQWLTPIRIKFDQPMEKILIWLPLS